MPLAALTKSAPSTVISLLNERMPPNEICVDFKLGERRAQAGAAGRDAGRQQREVGEYAGR